MISDNDRIEKFEAVINKTANKKIKKHENKAKEFIDKECLSIETEMKTVLENRLKFELDRINSSANKQISAIENESKKAISEKRARIKREVFLDAEKAVSEFSKSGAYEDFIKKSIETICLELGEGACLFCRNEDKNLLEKHGAKNIEISDDISLGGIYGCSADKSVYIYDTLDTRLETFKENFFSIADLSV